MAYGLKGQHEVPIPGGELRGGSVHLAFDGVGDGDAKTMCGQNGR